MKLVVFTDGFISTSHDFYLKMLIYCSGCYSTVPRYAPNGAIMSITRVMNVEIEPGILVIAARGAPVNLTAPATHRSKMKIAPTLAWKRSNEQESGRYRVYYDGSQLALILI